MGGNETGTAGIQIFVSQKSTILLDTNTYLNLNIFKYEYKIDSPCRCFESAAILTGMAVIGGHKDLY